MITNKAGEYTKRRPAGVYDSTIVCSKCESIWQEWYNYAQLLLADKSLSGQIRYHNNKKICYIVDNYDYRKLKLFFISMVWRASVSSQPFFSKVSLGEFEDVAKKHITNNDPGGSDVFSVHLAKFDHPLAKIILDPHEEKYSNVNYLRFYLADYIAYIKVDNRPAPRPYSQIALAENKPLYIICRDFERSKELKLIVNMANQQAKRLR
ncbi:hypothetical protein ACFLTY_04150 [Chloroflexota bacterium]